MGRGRGMAGHPVQVPAGYMYAAGGAEDEYDDSMGYGDEYYTDEDMDEYGAEMDPGGYMGPPGAMFQGGQPAAGGVPFYGGVASAGGAMGGGMGGFVPGQMGGAGSFVPGQMGGAGAF